jgi:molecular chaperone HscB
MPTDNLPRADMSSAHSLCWSCRQESGSGPFCVHCVKIQPVQDMGDYFDLFGIERSFVVDPDSIKKTFFELSRKFHPDFYAGHTEEEKIVARDNTAYLNAAFKVLSDPIHRAEYLLSLTSGSFSSAPAPPQELFEEILEIGELLENSEPSAEQRERLTQAGDNFRTRQQDLIDSLEGLFSKLLNGNREIKGEIEACLNSIKYLRAIMLRIDKAVTENRDD